MLKLYNTETREKHLISSKSIKMYTCGPTIYDFAHIGNFRTYIVEDLLRRVIRYFGANIEQVMNITDLDDKTIRGALQKNIPLKQYTEPFKKAFFEDLKVLNIEPVEHYPEATEYIPQMIEMIQELLDQGYAYQAPSGSIYFSIAKFPRYGRLSHLDLSDLKINASGDNEVDEYGKEDLSDFVLWKIFDPKRDGTIFWESPFGKGRPGWHIECSAMARSILGDHIDLHCGGVDNLFPHHENEIAQSECCSGQLFVKHWLHVEHLLVDHKKMSKSLKNFYTLRDLLEKGYRGVEVRYLLLSSHYRMQLNFTFEGLKSARSSLQRIEDFILRLKSVEEDHPISHLLPKADEAFKEAISDDLNLSKALAVLFDLIREMNILMDRNHLGKEEAGQAIALLKDWNQVLGLSTLEDSEEEVPLELQKLLEKRERARLEKNWSLSDEIRDLIHKEGYLIEDTPSGARLKKA